MSAISPKTNTHMIIQVNDYLLTWIEGFLIDRKARGLTINSLLYYSRKLNQFNQYAETQAVTRVSQIDSNLIRQFLLWMEATGHTVGGRLAAFRALRAFLHWYEEETDEKTAIHKVKPPRAPVVPLEGVTLETVLKLVDVCETWLPGGISSGPRARIGVYHSLPACACGTVQAKIHAPTFELRRV